MAAWILPEALARLMAVLGRVSAGNGERLELQVVCAM
jgi:hypothetical protein